jgi:hypothetical protein
MDACVPHLAADQHDHAENGGAGRDRTDDLKLAKLPLSQLSYSPLRTLRHDATIIADANDCAGVVGLGRFELPTSPLSRARSNQLSYRPAAQLSAFAAIVAKASMGRKRNEGGDIPL